MKYRSFLKLLSDGKVTSQVEAVSLFEKHGDTWTSDEKKRASSKIENLEASSLLGGPDHQATVAEKPTRSQVVRDQNPILVAFGAYEKSQVEGALLDLVALFEKRGLVDRASLAKAILRNGN